MDDFINFIIGFGLKRHKKPDGEADPAGAISLLIMKDILPFNSSFHEF